MKPGPLEFTRRQVGKGLLFAATSCLASRAYSQAPRKNLKPRRDKKSKPGIRKSRQSWQILPPTPVLPDTAVQGNVEINGTDIYFAQFGRGTPVLLLHGGLANSNYWAYQVRELAKKYTVIVMDTRGHGRSPVTSGKFSYRIFADDVAGLLDLLEIPSVAVVGWSDGAITGLQLAMLRPGRVSKLFAFGANGTPGGLKPGGSRGPLFSSFAKRCRAEYTKLSPSPEKWPQLLRGLRPMWRTQPNFTPRKLKTVKTPTTISAGAHDEIIKRTHTEYLAGQIQGAKLVIQPNVSHFAMLQDPGQFNRALFQFLEAV